jgi:transposase InsO family protein
MKIDPYNHRDKYLRWKEKVKEAIPNISQGSSELILQYLGDMEKGIKHIRTAIHSPTTSGKIERFFQTLDNELKFCKDAEHFRMRYNHFRPHTSLLGKAPADIYFTFDKLF